MLKSHYGLGAVLRYEGLQCWSTSTGAQEQRYSWAVSPIECRPTNICKSRICGLPDFDSLPESVAGGGPSNLKPYSRAKCTRTHCRRVVDLTAQVEFW